MADWDQRANCKQCRLPLDSHLSLLRKIVHFEENFAFYSSGISLAFWRYVYIWRSPIGTSKVRAHKDHLSLTLNEHSREDIIRYTEPKLGYTRDSPAFVKFVNVLVNFSASERKAFLQFTTGCSSLPPGNLSQTTWTKWSWLNFKLYLFISLGTKMSVD